MLRYRLNKYILKLLCYIFKIFYQLMIAVSSLVTRKANWISSALFIYSCIYEIREW